MAGTAAEPRVNRTSPVVLVVWFLCFLALFGTVLFWPAGRLDWLAGWLYLGILLASVGINYFCLERWNPGLIERRLHPGNGTKTWDKVWSVGFGPVFLAIYVVAGLDVRHAWSEMAAGWWWLGLAIFIPGNALLTWSMTVNPFFEKTVRIQTERGHHVIDTGPYAVVRHPGYTGFFGWAVSAPLLLGSWWAFVPAVVSVAGIVLRTALEDRTLHAELAGYPEYAERVRSRLVPGVW